MANQSLHDAWQQIGNQTSAHNSSINLHDIIRRSTALDNLANRYRRFSRLGVVMALFSIVYILNPAFPSPWNIILGVYLIFFFALCSLMDYRLYQEVSEIDIVDMGVEQVAVRALKCRRHHHISMIILMPLAFIFVGSMMILFRNDVYMIAAMCVGLVLGLAIGLYQYFRFMADYRRLTL